MVSLLGFASGSTAQNSFNMPYSQFGVGTTDLPYVLPTLTRMGGVVHTRSGNNYINPFNPASYGSIGMESFVFDMGVSIQLTRLENSSDHASDADGNISHLMVGMPLTKWWKVAAGLLPYSSVDYVSVQEGAYNNGLNTVKNIYEGNGGINMVFVGSAFNILGSGMESGRRLQAGFNVELLTGHIQRALSYSFQNVDTTHFMNKRRYKETKLANVVFDLGLQYWEPLGERYTLGVGLTYKPYRKLDIDEEMLVYTYHTSDQSLADTIFPAAGDPTTIGSTLELDHTFGIGLSLERNQRWLVAADATFAGWSGMKYTEGTDTPLFGQSTTTTGPYSRYALGFEKIGSMDASSYWGRISWSAGIHTERGAMSLQVTVREEVINEWGCGLGAALPMRKGRSLLTLSVDYRSFGNKDLLQRRCLSFGIAVSSCERWFSKRKYN